MGPQKHQQSSYSPVRVRACARQPVRVPPKQADIPSSPQENPLEPFAWQRLLAGVRTPKLTPGLVGSLPAARSLGVVSLFRLLLGRDSSFAPLCCNFS